MHAVVTAATVSLMDSSPVGSSPSDSVPSWLHPASSTAMAIACRQRDAVRPASCGASTKSVVVAARLMVLLAAWWNRLDDAARSTQRSSQQLERDQSVFAELTIASVIRTAMESTLPCSMELFRVFRVFHV